MFQFSKRYFLLTLLLFITEVLIALFVHDNFVRPYIGDVLVVILIYTFVMSFFRLPYLPIAIGVLLFAFFVETLQYFKIVEVLGLQDNKLARIVIGTSFSWADIQAYIAGFLIIYIGEKLYNHEKFKNIKT